MPCKEKVNQKQELVDWVRVIGRLGQELASSLRIPVNNGRMAKDGRRYLKQSLLHFKMCNLYISAIPKSTTKAYD